MAVARPLLALCSIILLAGGIVLQFFVILSGAHIYSTPENQIYFLQASTDGVPGAPNPARWTYFSLCGVDSNDLDADCSRARAGFPFDPVNQFGAATGLPDAFSSSYYYQVSVAAWSFYLIALFFAVVAFFASAVALCFRLGAFLVGATTLIAWACQTVCASLMTAWVVEARNGFRSNNQNASIGVKAMAFTWAAWAAWFIATILFCVGGAVGKGESTERRSYFGRKRSTRSRGSFIESESQRRVKDEYD